jgi:hypothetical protein
VTQEAFATALAVISTAASVPGTAPIQRAQDGRIHGGEPRVSVRPPVRNARLLIVIGLGQSNIDR